MDEAPKCRQMKCVRVSNREPSFIAFLKRATYRWTPHLSVVLVYSTTILKQPRMLRKKKFTANTSGRSHSSIVIENI